MAKARGENSPIIYPYLAYAINARKCKIGEIAMRMGISADALSGKLHGRRIMRLEEAVQIKKILGVKWSLDKLFYVIDESGLGGKEDGDFA